MPIEIRELHIKINVDNKRSTRTGPPMENAESCVAECVAQVVQIIANNKER